MNTLHPMQELKMLLVDDDDSIRTSLNFYFGKKGVSFKSFATAELALDYLGKSDADLVITDYLLPGLNGLEFVRKLNWFKPKIMKILITAYGNLNIAMEAVELGIHDFIRKPFNTKTIETAIIALMKRDARETNRFFLDGRRMELPGTSPVGSGDCPQVISPSIFYGRGTAESGPTRKGHEARTAGNLPCIISKARGMDFPDKELLDELISTCVDFSHPKEWVDINCIIRESINSCSARAKFDNIEICFETGGPSMIKTNRDHLHDIIHNILTNSIRGLRSVSIPRKKIGIAIRNSESSRSIIITDNGKEAQPVSTTGATVESLEANPAIERLELRILSMLAERIGASLLIHSKPAEGTTMEIAFQLQAEMRNETMS